MHHFVRSPITSTAFFLVLTICGGIAALSAQIPGRNVNMVSGGTFPGGDPFLQKQNEPSLAISTRNPCHLLAGANDYRAVQLPGLPEDKEIGDAWGGWYESTDCGATWYSKLVPGYLQDNSPEGLASPVKGLTAAADPQLRASWHGTFYYLFIAFNRGSNVGKLALARAIDHNDRESFINPDLLTIDPNGTNDQRRALSPIGYGGTTEIARGSAGQFIDRPDLEVFPAATGTCTIDGETVPATNVYVSWTEFIGNNPENQRSKVYFARSADCGQTLAGPATKLTEGYPLNQNSLIAINPQNPNEIYVVWRQIRNDRVQDAILFSRSTDGGRSFTKGEFVPGLGEGQFKPFDQNTTSTLTGNLTTTFRTLGGAFVVFPDDGYLYLGVTQPLAPNPNSALGGFNSRIMLMRRNATTLAWDSMIQAVPSVDHGQQIMPSLAYAAGKLNLIWYDLRFDESGLTNRPLIDEVEAFSAPDKIRHTLDVLGAQAKLPFSSWPPPPAEFFQLYGVSQPDFNDTTGGVGTPRGPRISQYTIGDPDPSTPGGAGPRQLQFNIGNALTHGGGRIPFIGDYIHIAGRRWVLNSAGQYVYNGLTGMDSSLQNTDNVSLGTFHAAWTDNRDVKLTPSGVLAVVPYSKPVPLPPDMTLRDAPPCEPATDHSRTRDSNVYTSRITQDFSLTVPGNAKPTNILGVVRAYAVHLANGTDEQASFTLTLTDPAASFSRLTFDGTTANNPGVTPACKAPVGPIVNSITVDVLPKSSVTRTVYVNCNAQMPNRRVVVTATRTAPLPTASASAIVNGDPSNPAAKGGDGQPLGPETHTPDAENPDAENPDAENPDAENPDAENPDAENPDAENPDAENPDAENPDAENPDAENPDAENPDAENANFQDISVDVSNDGSTTSGYQVKYETTSSTNGYQFLLLGNRVYATPTSINCYLVKRYYNEQLFAIPDPDLTPGDFLDENDPSADHATVIVRPGESIRVTLRIVRDSMLTPQPFCEANATLQNGDPNPNYCFAEGKFIFRARALAPNTGETDPREDVIGALPDLIVEGTVDQDPFDAGFSEDGFAASFVDLSELTISNTGTGSAGTDFSWVSIWASGTDSVQSGFVGGTGSLAAGGTIPTGPIRVYTTSFDPDGDTPIPIGTYNVGLHVDRANQVPESDETNNTAESADSVVVNGYRLSFAFSDPFLCCNTETEPVTVTVSQTDGTLVSGANVTLTLEGPDTSASVPGPESSDMTPTAPVGVTDASGQVTFNQEFTTDGNVYRFIATVSVPGVGIMKFQSATFTVNSP